MSVETIVRDPRRNWGLAALVFLALVAFAYAAVTVFHWQRSSATLRVTISSGINDGQRSENLAKFVLLAASQGVIVNPIPSSDSTEVLERADAGALDFAVIQGGIDFSRYKNVRQVTSLQVMPLHVLVKDEIADEVTAHLGSLRGKVVNLGSGQRSSTYWLSREVLAYVGLSAGTPGQPDDFHATSISPAKLAAEPDRARLPDALFLSTVLPSPIVHKLVQRHYRLIPLLFRDAFTLGVMTEPARVPGATDRSGPEGDGRPIILREQITDTVIPAFTYQADPAVPPAPLHTFGTRALLIANHRVAPHVVRRVLTVLFQTRYAKIVQPPLDLHRLEEIPEIPWHLGSVEFLELSKPILTGEFVSQLVDLGSILGPTLGGMLFMWQYLRRRTLFRSERSFEAYIAKVSALEQAALEQKLTREGALDEAECARLWYALSQLKTEALGKFARGEMSGDVMLTSFLTHVNDARAHLAHLREIRHDEARPAEPTHDR